MIKHRDFLRDLQTSEQFYNDQESRQIIGELIAMIDEGFNKQPKTDWIPCEERLPSKHDDYIVTYKETNNGKVRYYTSEAWFKPQIREWYGNVSIPNLEREVIAWQEKLKPYEEMTEREGKCLFEQPFPRGDAYICKKTALICTAEKLKFCKYKQPYKKEGAE
jgi:hypothetical protein